MIHLYCGDGKGKTTAACGLALRAAGAGMRVLFVQFFKNGQSPEIGMLKKCGVNVFLPTVYHGRFAKMTDQQKAEIREEYDRILQEVTECAENYDMIVFDEAVSAYRYQCIDQKRLVQFLKSEGAIREIILTGRDPAEELTELANYLTEMKKIRHPFDQGVKARKGIEF